MQLKGVTTIMRLERKAIIIQITRKVTKCYLKMKWRDLEVCCSIRYTQVHYVVFDKNKEIDLPHRFTWIESPEFWNLAVSCKTFEKGDKNYNP